MYTVELKKPINVQIITIEVLLGSYLILGIDAFFNTVKTGVSLFTSIFVNSTCFASY